MIVIKDSLRRKMCGSLPSRVVGGANLPVWRLHSSPHTRLYSWSDEDEDDDNDDDDDEDGD